MKLSTLTLRLGVHLCTYLCALVCSGAQAAASVSYVKPEAFIDLPFMLHEREQTLKELTAHFGKLAGKLPAGQDLTIEVTDIDLAGRMEPFARGDEIRVLRGGADWPAITFRYSVQAGGRAVKSGEARVVEMNYLRSFNQYPASEWLRHEKHMLDTWFAKTILVAP